MDEGPFEHGDHVATVFYRPSKEAHDEGFVPIGVRYGGDMIACAGCLKCGWKAGSSIVSVTPVSEDRQKKDRLEFAVSLFRGLAPPSCEDAKLLVLALSVMTS